MSDDNNTQRPSRRGILAAVVSGAAAAVVGLPKPAKADHFTPWPQDEPNNLGCSVQMPWGRVEYGQIVHDQYGRALCETNRFNPPPQQQFFGAPPPPPGDYPQSFAPQSHALPAAKGRRSLLRFGK